MNNNFIAKYKETFKTYYYEVNKDNNQHIGKEIVKQWLAMITNDSEIIDQNNKTIVTIKQYMEGEFDSWMDEYLGEMLNLETESLSKVEFRYEECVSFLEWLLQRFSEDQQRDVEENQEVEQNYNNEEEENVHSVQVHGENQNNQQQKIKQNQKLLQSNSINSDHISPKISQKAHQLKQQLNQLTNQPNEFAQSPNQQSTNSIANKLKLTSNSPQSQQQLKLPQQDERYKDYLQTIFQHYCKINFGLNKDNTFDNMQKHVSIITINKFMIFVNDFQITVLLTASMVKQGKEKANNKVHIRNLLMDVFKKNTHFQKQMNLEQFLTAINKIAEISFAQMKQHQNPISQQKPLQKSTQFTYEMIKMIKYLEISNFKEFKQKMIKLNINFSLKFNKQLQEKKMPINYKFKYESEEHKNAEQMSKPPLPTKMNGQGNFNKKPKHNLEIGRPQINSKLSTPNIPILGGQNLNVRQRKGGSTKNLPSQFNHNHLQNQNQRKDPFENNNKNGKSMEKRKNPIQTHVQQPAIEGYTNIHMAKKGLSLDQNKNSTPGIRKKGEFQLNNVIEEARKQAKTKTKVYYDYQDARSGRALSNLSASKPLSQYSRDPTSNQSQRDNREDLQIDMIHKPNKPALNALGQLQRSRLDPHNQLRNLIDFNESDEDEYLDQHLQKEKDHDTEMGMRVQKKISQFNYKI